MGCGRHFITLTTEEKSGALLWTMVGFCPGVYAFGLPKLAVVYLLTQLLNTGRAHKTFLWTMGIFCNVALTIDCVLIFARCTPAESQWDFSLADQQECFDMWILAKYAIFTGG